MDALHVLIIFIQVHTSPLPAIMLHSNEGVLHICYIVLHVELIGTYWVPVQYLYNFCKKYLNKYDVCTCQGDPWIFDTLGIHRVDW